MGMDIYSRLFLGMAMLLLSALITPWLARSRKGAGWCNFLFCLAAALLFASIGTSLVGEGAAPHATLIRLGSLSIPFLVDGFSAIFLMIIAVMGVMVAFYSIGYMEHYPDYGLSSYYFNMPLLLLGMAGVVSVDDLSIGFSLAWQVMTLSSYILIRFDHKNVTIRRNALKYLLLMELAWMAIVVAVSLIPGVGLCDALHELSLKVSVASQPLSFVIYGMVLLGFALKAGLFPLGQLWLPDAHSVAPSPISALLSGVMIKTGIYGIGRTLFWMLPAAESLATGRILAMSVAAFGVATLFFGTVQAIKQEDAKRLHAYSSIGQMGYITLGLGTALYFWFSDLSHLKILCVIALLGAIYHVINHAFFKGLLFLSTGSVQYATGSKDLNKLGGLIKLMPITALTAAVASASVAGIPAFSGFMSKWAIISAGLLAGKSAPLFALFALVALMVGAVTLALYVKFFTMTFTASGVQWNIQKEVREVGVFMLTPKIVLAFLCLAQGLMPFLYIDLIVKLMANSSGSLVQGLFADALLKPAIKGSLFGMTLSSLGAGDSMAAAMPLMLTGIFIVIFIAVYWFKWSGGSSPKAVKVWMCGYQQLGDRNRFRSVDMYAAFKDFMKWTGGNVK